MSGIGHIGELAVINHFEQHLRLPVYLPLKDTGIDFIAGRDGAFYEIQVKTSKFQKESYFWFDLHRSKLRCGPRIFYVLVCYTPAGHTIMGRRLNFLVLPSKRLSDWIAAGDIISKSGNRDVLNLFVYPNFEQRTWRYRNKGHELDLTTFWNNWATLAIP